MSDEKTEEPTQKKLDDAKKKGQHAKSQDATQAVGLLAGTICLSSLATSTAERLMAVVTRTLDALPLAEQPGEWLPLLQAATADGLLAILPFVAVSVAAGLVGQAMQVGLGFSMDPLTPKFEKLNPAEGLKKIFSMKSVIELVKTIVKAVALVSVMWVVVGDLLPLLIGSAYLPTAGIAAMGWTAVIKLFGAAVVLYLVLGPLDFGLQKFMFLKDQRMSKDEVKREHKESEGDPQLKGKRKQLARELATSAPRQSVPGSTVVVTNPTHYAVALRYVGGDTPLPIVVAKGVDAEAAVIRGLAEDHRVPIVQDPPLARALYLVPLGEPIPPKLFDAVATVLRWVALLRAES